MNNIPTMTKNLLIVNLLAFVATMVLERGGVDLAALHIFYLICSRYGCLAR